MADVHSSTRADARASSQTSSTTRRAIIVGIAAAPAGALPVAALADTDSELILQVEAIAQWEIRKDAGLRRFDETEGAYWEAKHNLTPFVTESDRQQFVFFAKDEVRWSEKSYDAARRSYNIGEGPAAMVRFWSRLAEVRAALDHAEAEDARVKIETSHAAADDAMGGIWAEWGDRLDRLCGTPAHTLRGLQAKASVARYIVASGCHEESGQLLASIKDDLLRMGGAHV